MDEIEAAQILMLASCYDNRTISEIGAIAWADALPDISFEEAKQAVKAYYREADKPVTVAEIVRRVRSARAELHQREQHRQLMADYGPPEPRDCGNPECQCDHKSCSLPGSAGWLTIPRRRMTPEGVFEFWRERCPACSMAKVGREE